MIVLHPHHVSLGPLWANKVCLKKSECPLPMLMWPFPALRIKTDLKVFSESFIGKRTEIYECRMIFGETEGEILNGFLKYVLNKNLIKDSLFFLLFLFNTLDVVCQ